MTYPAPARRPGVATPPSNLVWGILATIFCCLPAGIVSIVYAAQVNTKWSVGDFDGARSASRNAATWATVSAGVTVLILLVYLILVVSGLVSLDSTSTGV